MARAKEQIMLGNLNVHFIISKGKLKRSLSGTLTKAQNLPTSPLPETASSKMHCACFTAFLTLEYIYP